MSKEFTSSASFSLSTARVRHHQLRARRRRRRGPDEPGFIATCGGAIRLIDVAVRRRVGLLVQIGQGMRIFVPSAVAKVDSADEGVGLIHDDQFFVVRPKKVVDGGAFVVGVTEDLR